MPDSVIINGLPPHDGEYPIELDQLDMDEFHLIKTMTGIVAGEIEDALVRVDTDVFVGLAAVVIRRSGKRVTDNVKAQLWGSKLGQIRVKLEPDDPPAKSQKSPSGNGGDDRPSDRTSSSGSDGKDASETSEAESLEAIGAPDSEPSAISALEISAA